MSYTVERWADESAAAVTGDRELAARAIAHAALAAAAAPARRAAPAAMLGEVLGVVGFPRAMRQAGPVPRRVAALLSPSPRRQLLLLAAVVLLVAVSGAAALEAARDLHALLEAAQAASP